LARRSCAGVDVTLYWHPAPDELIVGVWDEPRGAHFEIRPQRYLALDAYYHPTHTPTSQARTKRRTDVPPREVDLERLMAERRIRARTDRLGELGMASQDVPIEVVPALEVRPWLLAQLPTEGGQ
jgi:hypothetical protein